MKADQRFSPQEVALMSDAGFFRAKAVIMRKVRDLLSRVHEALRQELAHVTLLAPPGFNPGNCQFVKGEHLEQCPYQYLDYPKHFAGGNAFTFRSLFWWGHHVAFALLLEGPHVKQYKRNLIDRYHLIAGCDLEMSLAPDFWEWKRGEGYTLPLSHDRKARIGAVIAERSFLKILRFVPITEFGVLQDGLPEIGRDTFRSLLPVITP
ncbi:MAG TPA: hypothetical protein VHF07_07345 [Nitrospiraceae bacterium]|nr:hypothetical protein [Nitrospiraceae bacterium]